MLRNFFISTELWANIFGGIIAALVFALLVQIWNIKIKELQKKFIVIMDKAIKHRNIGENNESIDKKEWIELTKSIENEAKEIALKLSPAAGSMIDSLDRVDPPYPAGDEFKRYLSILNKIIERMRGILDKFI
jgi:hypothetical protein